MKIGIISDTHDQYENILKAVKMYNNEKVELVIHCGDWISPFTLAFYKDLTCPIKGVFGNNDGDRYNHLFVSAIRPSFPHMHIWTPSHASHHSSLK